MVTQSLIPIGASFDEWTVVARTGDRPLAWLIRCRCGTERSVGSRKMKDIRTGRGPRSCGCSDRRFKESPLAEHPDYEVWKNMKRRCLAPGASEYSRYGGRGITVCDRWLHSFENFIADMGPRPSPEHSIDRKDNDGPYSAANCRWATREQQSSNTSQNRRIEALGRTLTLSEWARETGVRPSAILSRLDRGWSIEAAVSTPSARPARAR